MLDCWRSEPSDRPPFPFLCQMFGQLLKSIDSVQYHQILIEPLYQSSSSSPMGIDNPLYVNDRKKLSDEA
ncbi:unnamed protein product [Allacma fusca]|uniref:Uncharacterized protein n=1 Tax=Allacma fusca TaxID=39272 RepID=A0A8J2JRG9_9HEXA|nr:unnamed protein product [Allacma fusca]